MTHTVQSAKTQTDRSELSKQLLPTFPSLYKFGLNRTVWLPVVSKLISGGEFG